MTGVRLKKSGCDVAVTNDMAADIAGAEVPDDDDNDDDDDDEVPDNDDDDGNDDDEVLELDKG